MAEQLNPPRQSWETVAYTDSPELPDVEDLKVVDKSFLPRSEELVFKELENEPDSKMNSIADTSNSFNLQARKITPELISSVTSRIIYGVRPNQIHLFGSQANGQADAESDLDLLVVVDNQHDLAPLQHRFRVGKILDLFRYRRFGLDTIVLTEEEVQLLQAENEGEWDLVLDILATGKLLYERHRKAQD